MFWKNLVIFESTAKFQGFSSTWNIQQAHARRAKQKAKLFLVCRSQSIASTKFNFKAKHLGGVCRYIARPDVGHRDGTPWNDSTITVYEIDEDKEGWW